MPNQGTSSDLPSGSNDPRSMDYSAYDNCLITANGSGDVTVFSVDTADFNKGVSHPSPQWRPVAVTCSENAPFCAISNVNGPSCSASVTVAILMPQVKLDDTELCPPVYCGPVLGA